MKSHWIGLGAKYSMNALALMRLGYHSVHLLKKGNADGEEVVNNRMEEEEQ